MKPMTKLGSLDSLRHMSDEVMARNGTLGLIGGGLLALASLIF